MKIFLIQSIVILSLISVTADDRSLTAVGVCHSIMIESDSALFFPLNGGLSNEKPPYFITIEVAETENDLSDPKKCFSITQGIPLDVEAPYPIGLKLKEGKTQYYKVTVFSDADFVDWRRSQVYSINSEGILAIKPKPTEHDGGLNGLQP
jgi:hypothetical protein